MDCVIIYRDNGGLFIELDWNENIFFMLFLFFWFELFLNDERKNLNMLLDMLIINRKIVYRKNFVGFILIMKVVFIKVF